MRINQQLRHFTDLTDYHNSNSAVYSIKLIQYAIVRPFYKQHLSPTVGAVES